MAQSRGWPAANEPQLWDRAGVPPSPTGAPQWTSSIQATFRNPGYTFPVATLGSGAFITLTIGGNGGKLHTQSVVFAG